MTRPHLRHAVAAAALGFVAGCAGPTVPGQAVPQLAQVLSRVDDAIAHHQYRQARNELDNLVSIADTARESGDLDADQANQVLVATARLTAALPKPPRRPSPQPTPSQAPAGARPHGEHHREDWKKRRQRLRHWLHQHQDQQGDGWSGQGDD